MPINGLSAQFIIRIEEVTEAVLEGIKIQANPTQKRIAIARNIANIKKTMEVEAHQRVDIKSFYNGNQYFLFVTETFRDIRLVALPPASIANWKRNEATPASPEYAADFALFRIYATTENVPAKYAPENVPYQPKQFLDLSLEGVQEQDFTFLMGFPSTSSLYGHSQDLEQLLSQVQPARANIAEALTAPLTEAIASSKNEERQLELLIRRDRLVNDNSKLSYQSRILRRQNVIGKREAQEALLQQRIEEDPGLIPRYKNLLQQLEDAYAARAPFVSSLEYQRSFSSRYIELFMICDLLGSLLEQYKARGLNVIMSRLQSREKQLEQFVESFDQDFEEQAIANLAELYFSKGIRAHLSPFALEKIG